MNKKPYLKTPLNTKLKYGDGESILYSSSAHRQPLLCPFSFCLLCLFAPLCSDKPAVTN